MSFLAFLQHCNHFVSQYIFNFRCFTCIQFLFIILFCNLSYLYFFLPGKLNLCGTAASVWYFNPGIPEILPYHHYLVFLIFLLLYAFISYVFFFSFYKLLHNCSNFHTTLGKFQLRPMLFQHQQMLLNHLTSKSLSDYDLFNGWWYDSCPECNKGQGPIKK